MRIHFLITTFILALFGLSTIKTTFNPHAVLVGGEYTVQADETRVGDMLILFARVKIVEGGQVAGNIQVIGGVLEVAGQVGGDIHAYGSDVNVKTPSAQVDGTINTIYSLRGLPSFPFILLVIS
jgi:hypothetical protein